jgi:cardiolipin synthase
MKHVPNIITILRLMLVPVFIVALKSGEYDLAFWLFLVAGLSDGVDGYLARRYHLESHLGGILDPLADKVLMVSTYVMLTVLGHLPLWLLLVVVFRDFLIMGGYLMYTAQHGAVHMSASLASKLNTAMQLGLVVVVLANLAGILVVPLLVDLLMYSVLVTTVVSGAHYYWLWIIKSGVQPARKS